MLHKRRMLALQLKRANFGQPPSIEATSGLQSVDFFPYIVEVVMFGVSGLRDVAVAGMAWLH